VEFVDRGPTPTDFAIPARAPMCSCHGVRRSVACRPVAWFVLAHINAIASAAIFATLYAASQCDDDVANVRTDLFLAAFAFVGSPVVGAMAGFFLIAAGSVFACTVGGMLCCNPCWVFSFPPGGARSGWWFVLWSCLHLVQATLVCALLCGAAAIVYATPVIALAEAATRTCLSQVDPVKMQVLWALAGMAMVCGGAAIVAAMPYCSAHQCCHVVERIGAGLRYRVSREALTARYDVMIDDGITDEYGDTYNREWHYFITPAGGTRQEYADSRMASTAEEAVKLIVLPVVACHSFDDAAAGTPLLDHAS